MSKNPITTQQGLAEILIQFQQQNNPQSLDPSQWKYVIYARKSTDEKERQVRSLGDQIKECKDYAERNNLHVVDCISESETAHEPDVRPKFKKNA